MTTLHLVQLLDKRLFYVLLLREQCVCTREIMMINVSTVIEFELSPFHTLAL